MYILLDSVTQFYVILMHIFVFGPKLKAGLDKARNIQSESCEDMSTPPWDLYIIHQDTKAHAQ